MSTINLSFASRGRGFIGLMRILTMLVVSLFLLATPMPRVVLRAKENDPVVSEEASAEPVQDNPKLVRSGSVGLDSSKLIAITGLFAVLVLIGLHAYTTQIYPNQ